MRPIGLLIALALFLSGCTAAVLQEPAPSITVTGTASASGVPDTADVNAGVVTQAPTAAQALAQNSATMDAVLRAVSGLGIAARDVRTSGVNVMPHRAHPEPGRPIAPDIVGYEVHNQIHVKVRDLKLVGRLLDVLVAQGANTLGGMTLSIADPAPLLAEARARAIVDARRKAEVYATAAGAKVGKVIFIRDATAGPPRPMMMGRMVATQAAVPIAPGEQELEVSVSVTYGIE